MSSAEQKKASHRDKKKLYLQHKKRFCLKAAIFIVTFVALLLLSAVVVLTLHSTRDYHVNENTLENCSVQVSFKTRDKNKPGVFDSLTLKEYNSVVDYLFRHEKLNLVNFRKAYPNNSYIYMIDLHLPLKDSVLDHLDFGNRQPERTAYVVLVRGDLPSSRVEEYLVGPLPLPNYHTKVTNPSYTKFHIPYNSKPVDAVEYKFLYQILRDASKLLYPLLIESYGLSYHNCTEGINCLVFQDISPRGTKEGERQSWFGAYRDVEGFLLHPLGLEIQIDHSSRNIKRWNINRIVYNGYFSYTVETLMDTYLKGKLEKLKMPTVGSKQNLFSSLWRRGDSGMDSPLNGPTTVETNGHRYRVEGLHVSYMKWDFNFRMRTSSGLQLFDIRFNDERIAYEISFQEVVILYSGYGPLMDLVNIYGNSLMMGASASELIPGVDCPETSTFLNSDHFVNSDKPFRLKNSICIFEDRENIPLRRHYTKSNSGKFKFYGGLANYRLVVRTIINMRNYDYIFDYIFYLNGVLEAKVSLSGYVQSAFPLAHELRYGSTIHSNLVANIHQHCFHYKIDMDINGRDNHFATIDIGTENITRQWYSNARKTQLVYDRTLKQDEYEANFDYTSGNHFDIIYNKHTSSKYGSPRGYRILNNNKIQFLLTESDMARGASWAKFPLAITQFQDTEVMSTSIYNGNGPWDPLVDFERFLKNNDSVRDKDIVAWVTMGMYRIPHTEDVPTITTPGSRVTFQLLPFNFFTDCPSMSSNSAVHISKDTGTDQVNINTFGKQEAIGCRSKVYKLSEFDGKPANID